MAPFAGSCRTVVAAHRFVIDRPCDHDDGVPSLASARTRHQYVPFGTASRSVARVFFVRKSSFPWPRTGELNLASAATWNSYCSARGNAFHANGCSSATSAPLGGPIGTGARRGAGRVILDRVEERLVKSREVEQN